MANCDNNDTGQWICVRGLGSGAFGIVELWKYEGTQEQIGNKSFVYIKIILCILINHCVWLFYFFFFLTSY